MTKVIIKDKTNLEALLQRLIYNNTNALISSQIARLCKKFIKELEECSFND